MKTSAIIRQLIVLFLLIASPVLAEDHFLVVRNPLLCTESSEFLGVGDWFGYKSDRATFLEGTWVEVDDVSLDQVKGRAIERGLPAGDEAMASGIILWDEVEDKCMAGLNQISERSISVIYRQGR